MNYYLAQDNNFIRSRGEKKFNILDPFQTEEEEEEEEVNSLHNVQVQVNHQRSVMGRTDGSALLSKLKFIRDSNFFKYNCTLDPKYQFKYFKFNELYHLLCKYHSAFLSPYEREHCMVAARGIALELMPFYIQKLSYY